LGDPAKALEKLKRDFNNAAEKKLEKDKNQGW
jgi:hypothetical protein